MQSNVIRKLAGLNKQESYSAYILIRPILIPNYKKGATENGWPKALREVNDYMALKNVQKEKLKRKWKALQDTISKYVNYSGVAGYS